MKLKKLRYQCDQIHIMPGAQMGPPCFDWSLDLVLGGWPSKIEVIGVPGVYTSIQIFKEHVQIHIHLYLEYQLDIFFFWASSCFFGRRSTNFCFRHAFWCHIVVLWCGFCCAWVSDVFGCVSPILACVMFLVEDQNKTSNGGPGIYMYILNIPYNNTWIFGAKKNYPNRKEFIR